MGRNSKKNKGRKPVAEEGLKGATSLASASANVTTAPPRPSRTAKHKVRKFPPQPTTTPPTEVNDSPKVKGSQSPKEPQPVLPSLPPDNVKQEVENQETLPPYASATCTFPSPPTSMAILTESPKADSSLNVREAALHQPISSDSYEDSSSSSSETEMGVENVPDTHNVADILKIETKGITKQTQRLNVWKQEDQKHKDVDADKFASISMVAMDSKEVPQRADERQTPKLVAVPNETSSFTSHSSCLHDKLEAEISRLLSELAVEVQAADSRTSFEDGAIEENIPPLQVPHLKQEALLETETSKQTTSEDSNLDPAIARREEDSKTLEAKPVPREQSKSRSETTLIDALVTFHTSPDNLKHKGNQEQELEIVDGSYKRSQEDKDKPPAEKHNEQANFTKQIESTSTVTAAHQILPLAPAHNVEQEVLVGTTLQIDMIEETWQVDLFRTEEAPPRSIQESPSTFVSQQVEINAEVFGVDILPHQKMVWFEQSNLEVIQTLKATDSTSSLQSEGGQTTSAEEQQTHAEVEQKHGPEELNTAERGIVADEKQTLDQELKPSTEKEQSTSSIHDTVQVSRAEIINEAQQKLQESHTENLSALLKFDNEAEETNKENSSIDPFLERQEDEDDKLAAQSVVPEEAPISKTNNLLDSEQSVIERGEPEKNIIAINTRSECHEQPEEAYIFSVRTMNSTENIVEKLEMAETEAEGLVPGEKKKCQDEQPNQLDRGIVFEGHATDPVRTEQEKREVVELEVHHIMLDQEECQEKEPDNTHSGSVREEHKTTDTLENGTLDKDFKYQEEKPEQVYNDSVCKEHTRSLENAIEELEVGKSEVAIEAPQKEESEGKHSQLNDSRTCVEKKPEVVEPTELESATFEEEKELQEGMPDLAQSGYVCKEDATSSVEDQLEKEPEGDKIEFHEERESQEDESDQFDSRAASCDGHATDSVQSVMEKLQLVEPEVKDITLNKEDQLQVKPDGDSVSQEHILTDSLGYATENLDVEEPLVGGGTFHKDQECQKDELDQQLDRGLVGEVNSVESEMEKLEVGQPELKDACLQEKSDHAHCGSICEEDKTTDSLQNEMEKSNLGEPQVEGERDEECQEDKPDKQLDLGTVCEEHSTNSIESEMEKLEVREPEADNTLNKEKCLDKEECKEEKHHDADGGSVCEEHQQTEFLEHVIENPDLEEPRVESGMLDKRLELQEETPHQVDSDSVCEEHPTSNIENQIEKLEVGGLDNPIANEEEKACQEDNARISVENGMKQPELEVESATLEESKESLERIPDQIDRGYECEEYEMHSEENELEKPEVGESEVEGVALYKEKERREHELDQLIEDTTASVESEIEGREPEVALNKEESKEQKHHQADGDSLCCEEQQRTDLEHAMEKPVVEKPVIEPQVEGVMVDKDQESPEDKPDQFRTDTVSQEHPTRSMEDGIEKLEVGKLETAFAIKEEKECLEEHTTRSVERETDQPKQEVESANLEKKKESLEETPDHITSGHVHEEHEMHSGENEQEIPDVGEAKVETATLYKNDSQEDKLGQLERGTLYAGDARNSVENGTEKLELGTPELNSIPLNKEECEEPKHHHADDGSILGDNQVTEFLEHALEKPNVGELQVEGVTLDKDQESQEELYSNAVSEEKPTTPMENEIEKLKVEESERATPIKEDKECHEADSTKSLDNDMEEPKPAEESATPLEDKKDSSEVLPDQIDKGCEHEMQSVENELKKPEVEEPEVESVTLHDKKESQEGAFDRLERGTVCEGCTENSAKSEIEKLEVGKPEANTTALGKEEGEEKHAQADNGFVCEEHKATDSIEHAMEKPDVEEPQVEGPTLDKHQESPEDVPHQVDSDSVCQEHLTSYLESDMKKLEVGESQIAIATEEDKEDTIKSVDDGMGQLKPEVESATLEEKKENPEQVQQAESVAMYEDWECQEEKPEQVYSDSVGKEHIRSVKNEIEKLQVGESEIASAVDCETALPKEEKELQEENSYQVDLGYVCKEDETNSVGDQLEKEPEVGNVAFHEERECQEDKLHKLEGHVTNPIGSEMEKLQVGEPEVKDNTLDKEYYLQEQPSQSDATNSVESKMEKLQVEEPEVKDTTLDMEDSGSVCEEHQVESCTLPEEEKELQEEKPHQVDRGYVCKEDETNTVGDQLEKEPEVGNVEGQEDKPHHLEGHVTNSNGSELQVGEPEVKDNTPDKEYYLQEQPSQADATNSIESKLEKLQVDEPEVKDTTRDMEDSGSVCEEHQVESSALPEEEKELQEEKPYQVDRGYVCKEDEMNSVGDQLEKELEVGSVAFHEERECQEDKPHQLEGHVTNSNGSELQVGEPEVKDNTLDKEYHLQEQPSQADATNSVESKIEKLQVEEPEVKDITLDMKDSGSVCEEHQVTDDERDQFESDSMCDEHETKSVEVSEMKDPELEGVALHQIESQEGEPGMVCICFPNEQLVKASLEKDLEKFEVGEALEEQNQCQLDHADHTSSVSEEQAPKSEASDLQKLELGEPEAGVVLDKNECQEEPGQVHRSSVCEKHPRNLLEHELENPTMEEKLDLEEPEAAGAALDTVDCQEKEPCQFHTEPICEALEYEMEKLEVGELEDSVKLDEEGKYQEEKPVDMEKVSEGKKQTSSLESETEKLEAEDPEVILEEHQDDKPHELCNGSACEEPKVCEQEVASACIEEKGEEGPDQQVNSGCGYEEQTTESRGAELKREPEAEGVTQEVASAGVEEKKECQEEGPNQQVHSGCGYEEQTTKSREAELEREPGVESVRLDEIQASHEDKPDQIDSSSECRQQPAVPVEQEMEKLEVGEPQEGHLGKEESQKKDSDQLSSEFVCEDDTTNTAETDIQKLEIENPEVDILLDNKQWPKVEHHEGQKDTICKLYSTRSVEDMEKLEGADSEIQNVVLDGKTESEEKNLDLLASGSVSEEQTADFVGNETTKSEVGVPEVEDIMLDERECQSQIPDQLLNSSVSEEHATDSREYDMDKVQVRQAELGDNVAPEERRDYQETISEQVDNGSASETKKPEVEVIPLEEEKECQGGKPDQFDSRSGSEAHTVDSVENQTAKPEMEVPEVQDNVLDKKACDSEKTDQNESSPVREEHEHEVNQPEVENLDQVVAESTFAIISLKNETEKPEAGEPEVKDNVLDKECHSEKPDQSESSPVCEEHATDSKGDDKDDFEVEELEVGKPDHTIPSNAFVHEAHTLDSLKNETAMPEVGEPEVKVNLLEEKECHREKPDEDESSSVCGEGHATDSKENDQEKLEVNQPDAEKRDQAVVTSTSESEAHTCQSVDSKTEQTEEGVPEVEDNVLEQKECLGEKPDQDESSFECDEDATHSKETVKDELQVHQLEGGKPDQVVTDSTCVSDAHTLDSLMNETEKSEEGVPKVEDNVLEQKECLDEEPDQDENSSVYNEHARDSNEVDLDKLEVNQPEEGKPDEVITGTTSLSEAHTLDSLENETEKPEDRVQGVEDNVPEQRRSLGEKLDQVESGFACSESKESHNEVNQPEGGKPDQVVTASPPLSEVHTLDCLMNDTEKSEEGVPEVEVNVLEQKECLGEKHDQDERSSGCHEHATDLREIDLDKPEVRKPDQVITGSTPVSEAHALDSLEKETQKSEDGVQEVDDNVPEQKECFGEKPDQDESSFVCEEDAPNSKESHKDELEVNQPEERKPDQVATNSTSVSEVHTLDSLMNETDKSEEGVPEVEDNVLEQKECLGKKHDQNGSSSGSDKHAMDSQEADLDKLEVNWPEARKPDQVITGSTSISEAHTFNSLETENEKPEDIMQEVEANVLEQKECLGEEFEEDERSVVSEENAPDSKETHKNELQVNQPEGGKPDEVVTDSTSRSEGHTLDSLMKKPQKSEEGMPEVEDNVLKQKKCLGEKHDQDESSSGCDVYATDSKEVDLDKLEENRAEVGTPDQIITSSTSTSEAHTVDSLENETEKPEDGAQEDNLPERKDCLGGKPDQDKKSSLCEEDTTDSKDDMDKLEVNQPEVGEPEQVIADSLYVNEAHPLDSMKNEKEKPEEGQPEVEDNVLEQEEIYGEKPDQDESSYVCEERATDPKKDTMGNVEVSQPDVTDLDHVLPGSTPLSEHTRNSLENETQKHEVGVSEVEDDELASGTFSTTQEATPSSEDGYLKTKDEEQEAHPVDFPFALSPENRANESGSLLMAQDADQTPIHDSSTGENGQDEDLTNVPAEGKPEEIGFKQTTFMSNAPKHQEGTQEILGQLDTAKPEAAKQEPKHYLKSWEEDQEVHLTDVPALNQTAQNNKCNEVDVAMPLQNISSAQEANNVNLTTDGQEMEAKGITAHTHKQTGQCQHTTLAPAELQAQEAITVDGRGLELSTIQTNPSDVKEARLNIKQHKDGAGEQHSPLSVLQKQESPTEDAINFGIQEVGATRDRSDDAELSSDNVVQSQYTNQTKSDDKQSKKKETSAVLEELKSDFHLEEPAPICIPLHHTDVKIIETKPEPAKEDPDEAFRSLATPGIACSAPGNLLPLPM